jgi:hypothetical protein
MTFPINSTSVMTDSCARVCRVLQRARIRKRISYGGVFACRKIAGTDVWSQHSWGNALDLFPKDATFNDEIARAAVHHAKHRTWANRGRKLQLSNVIDHLNRRLWSPGQGWRPYGGTVGPHVHVQAAPIKTGTPPCA